MERAEWPLGPFSEDTEINSPTSKVHTNVVSSTLTSEEIKEMQERDVDQHGT